MRTGVWFHPLSLCMPVPLSCCFFFKFFFPLYGKKTSAKLAWQPLATCPPKWKLSPIACVSYHTCWVHATCCAQLHYLACWLLLTYPKDKMITGHAVQIHTDKTSFFFLIWNLTLQHTQWVIPSTLLTLKSGWQESCYKTDFAWDLISQNDHCVNNSLCTYSQILNKQTPVFTNHIPLDQILWPWIMFVS